MKWRRLVIWSAAALSPIWFEMPPLIYWSALVCMVPWVADIRLVLEPKWDIDAELYRILGRG